MPRLIPVDYDPFDYAGMLAASAAADTAHRGGYADWLRPSHEAENVPTQWETGRRVATGEAPLPQGSAVGGLAGLLAMGTAGGTIADVGRTTPSGSARGLMSGILSLGVPPDPIPFHDVPTIDELGLAGAQEAREQIDKRLYHPTSLPGQYANSIFEVAGNPLNWVGPGPLPAKAAWNFASGLGGEAGAGIAERAGHDPAVGRVVGSFAPMGVGELWRATGPMLSHLPQGAAGSFGGVLKQPQPERLADALAPREPRGIRAYHSSPYDFERFDASKIGTGEGAQTYGHGLYFAENPAVSGQGGQYWKSFLDRFKNTPEGEAARELMHSSFDRANAAEVLRRDLRSREFMGDNPDYAQTQEALRLLESGKPIGPRTYEVNIKARPEQMLDWDRPLVQQSEQVQAPIRDLLTWSGANPRLHDTYTGREISNKEGPLARYYGERRNPQIVSEALRDEGIPGIRYLDQGSRGLAQATPEQIAALRMSIASKEEAHRNTPWLIDAEKNTWGARNLAALEEEKRKLAAALNPTSNYVMFPGTEHMIDIFKVYGVAGLSMLPPAIAAQYQQRLQPVDYDPFAPTSQ